LTLIFDVLTAKMSLELIIGPMFSGKTSALISIIRKYQALGLTSVAYKPIIDDRNGEDDFIYSHDGTKIPAHRIGDLISIQDSEAYNTAKLIIIEEGQFFSDLYKFVLKTVETDKKHVVVAGLDGDRFRKPFGEILQLIPIADKITKITSFCKACGDGTPALFSFGLSSEQGTVLVGASEIYTPLCRKHYIKYTRLSNCNCPECNEALKGSVYRPRCSSCPWDSQV